ncbi:MAG: hypothetical protein HRT86_15785 [Ilumatobacteraceae bacterium]|nr:hypothetical protein [Ilumatobacteraceae bacterium]
MHRRAALALGLVLFVLAVAPSPAAAMPLIDAAPASLIDAAPASLIDAAPASLIDAAPVDTVPPVTDNEFLPDERNLSDCVGALQRPGCGSEARGGWRQTLVFIIMGVAMIGVFGRVAYGVYRGRKHTDQAV